MNTFDSISDILLWLEEIRNLNQYHVEKIRFNQMEDWSFHDATGNLRHESGGFFEIKGINVTTNWGNVKTWSQPIIVQDEIGILGILLKYNKGIPYFLLQAKFEPGNINGAQLSPTVQATKSNYSKVHGGSDVTYLEHFSDFTAKKVIVDQLQSEQGSRFLRKRNRNIIIEIDKDIELVENFVWVSLYQIIELLKLDNIVNMNTRSVLAGFLSFNIKSIRKQNNSVHNINQIISWITQQKTFFELKLNEIPLNSVEDWEIDESQIRHKNNKYFSIVPLNVSIKGREVENWTQPILEPKQAGLCAFIVKKISGTWHFLVQAKVECGNIDIVELAPTVQCLNDNYENSLHLLPFLDFVLNEGPKQATFDSMLSEEGGRFYCEENRNMIIKVTDNFANDIPRNYIWMTLNQLNQFLKFNNYLNVQSRTLISALVGRESEYN